MRFLATFQIYDFLDTLVSLASAFVLGTLIGAERQYRQRTAGLRTNVLVTVGAAAFVDLAMHLAGADGAVGAAGTYKVIADRAEAIAYAVRQSRPGDVLIVAGKGHELGQEAAGVVRPFDDRVVLRAAIENFLGAGR